MNNFTKIKNLDGLTLTELIIVTFLLGVFMLGVTSFDFATKRGAQVSSSGSLEAMRIAAAMLQISKDAALAVGNQVNPGVIPCVPPWDGSNTCVYLRQDDNTPNDLTDNQWVAYKYNLSTNSLDRCLTLTTSGAFPACINGTSTITLQNNVSTIFNLVTTGGDFYLDVNLTTRAQPTQAFNNMTNPNHFTNNHVNLPAHSW